MADSPDAGERAGAGALEEIERGRVSYARRAWSDAWTSLSRADRKQPLTAEDLELLATAAYMIGRDAEFASALERAHHRHLDTGDTPRAVRCAFWLGIDLAARGEVARAAGWFHRGQRLVEREQRECVELGYLLLPRVLERAAAADWQAASATAGEAAAIAERFGDPDLFALALHEQGRALARQGMVGDGLSLLDEAMVAVTADELSPIVTGLIYCSAIAYCHELYELRRAREWTAALAQWCERQPQMVSYTGQCLVHRAEIMQLRGAWQDALAEAQKAEERFARQLDQPAAAHREGAALYRRGEVHRLQGELVEAERAYRQASRCGLEPQPGLALLRLAQGKHDAAATAIRRVVAETQEGLARARVLPAHVEIMLAIGATEEAAGACRELEEIARTFRSAILGALAEQARGAVAAAEGDPGAALPALRHAVQIWQDLEAPYETARVRVLIGLACAALADEDAAALELEAARAVFAELGAMPDVARVDSLARPAAARKPHGLTPRELEVLRLVAAGKTNKEIAAELVVSERTIDRHVSNIFRKLRVGSRVAATAFAYEHELV
jgi:DNA-binding CsgD family transcriptional regulator